MRKYRVFFKSSADRALRKLPHEVQRRIVGEVAMLAHDPRPAGTVKLAGGDNLWRIRVGNYRVVYEIHDDRLVVLVLRVAHRKDVS
jgi:mRNA interferase RelE/StbE